MLLPHRRLIWPLTFNNEKQLLKRLPINEQPIIPNSGLTEVTTQGKQLKNVAYLPAKKKVGAILN